MCPRERGTENIVCVCERERETERTHCGYKTSQKENAKQEIQLLNSEAKALGSRAVE